MMKFEGLRPAFGFGGLEPELCDYENSKYVMVSAPYDSTTSYKVGTREGPQAIIEASMNMELFDIETQSNPCDAGICTLPAVEPDMGAPEKFIKRLEDITAQILKDNKFVITLGGEHSISFGPIAAYAAKIKKSKKSMAVLQIDAHSDLRDEFEGTPANHACVMHRVREELGIDTIHVGIRSCCEEEFKYIKKNKVPVFWGSEVSGKLVEKTGDILKVLKKYDYIYLSIDIDGLDPSIVPGTGTPEPGGLFWYETLHFIKSLVSAKKIAGFDVVELMPIAGNHSSDFLTCKLIYKIIAYLEKYSKK